MVICSQIRYCDVSFTAVVSDWIVVYRTLLNWSGVEWIGLSFTGLSIVCIQ